MRSLTLVLALTLPLGVALPALGQSVTVTGANGGTLSKDRTCLRGNGAANCETTTTATGANGQTASKTRFRTSEPGSSTTTVDRTGSNGQTRDRSRTVTVSR
ncbi:hypothetical protein BYZ73_11040 [Rhodovulum viride]|uniref:Uncharacterized protein n=1 Tax=Rhodovulum viride TaxID=1231134 RepID=A0ABX9DFS6_9RHOB|nr:hypothetical protein [Rhodovulum viride]RAP41207.1 hypothetical protein BYZ73_11040 [Rhodovulum viride]